jgi:hypothetical protein
MLKDKFMKTCTDCDGTCTEEIGAWKGLETVDCSCENGKYFDWKELEKEIESTEERIEQLELNKETYYQLGKKYLSENDKNLVFSAFQLMVKSEQEQEKSEMYLAELEELN